MMLLVKAVQCLLDMRARPHNIVVKDNLIKRQTAVEWSVFSGCSMNVVGVLLFVVRCFLRKIHSIFSSANDNKIIFYVLNNVYVFHFKDSESIFNSEFQNSILFELNFKLKIFKSHILIEQSTRENKFLFDQNLS